MAIFVNKPITRKNVKLRLYHYSDWERGYGDGGTAGIVIVPLNSFKVKREKSVRCNYFYIYSLKKSMLDKIRKRIGSFDDYEFYSDKLANQEIRQAQNILKMYDKVIKFS
jgi:hypothetical protein